MKKVLIITNHSFMLWQFRRELIQTLLERSEVVIAVPFGDHVEDFRALGCRMIHTELDRRGIDPVKDLALCRAYRKILKSERPDMVITYSIKPNVYAGFCCRMMGIPYCANVQGLGTAFQKKGLAQLVTLMYKAALKDARVVFFENDGNAAEFRQRGIMPPDRQKVLRGAGVNLERFSYREFPENDPVRFLYLGRIMKEKGVDELFCAARRLRDEGYAFALDLVGFFEDGYGTQVDALANDGIAVFHGFQQDPLPYYAAADCVVLPSYHEGMSNVLLEGAATGRPLITSHIPGCREAVLNGESGFLCPVRDGEAVYEAMKKVLSLSREERRAMGLAGRRHMEAEFDKHAVVRDTIQAIRNNN